MEKPGGQKKLHNFETEDLNQKKNNSEKKHRPNYRFNKIITACTQLESEHLRRTTNF